MVAAVNRHGLSAVAVVLLLVIAGCSAPTGGTPEPTDSGTPPSTAVPTTTPTKTATPVRTPESRVTVYGDLPVNATLVWERVESLLGGEYESPAVVVRDWAPEPRAGPFATHLGLAEGNTTFDEGRVRASYSQGTERVRISPRNGSREQMIRVLAHEYVHAVQFRTSAGNQTGFLDRVLERDGFRIQRALIEGSAVYVEDTYTRQFLGFSAIEQRCAEYEEGTPYDRYAGQTYCFGGQYFAATLDSPSDLLSPNTTLPNTTEQVLHPGTSEQPATLTVVDETPTDWYTPASFAQQGELFVRTVLGVELPEQRAVDAAEGWGNDRLVRVRGETEGYVWILRWDTVDDAEEFESAFADYLGARGNETADEWRVDDDRYRLMTVDDRTVAVVTGNETFVDAVSVTERGGNVTVSAAP